MPHQDSTDIRTNLQALKAVFRELLPAKFDLPKSHGNASLEPQALAAMAITCWGWLQGTLEERTATAQAMTCEALQLDFTATRQGLLKALARHGEALIPQVVAHIADQLRELKGDWTQRGKVNFAVDGAKFLAPRTAANQQQFASKKEKQYASKSNQSKAESAQLLATVVWHLTAGLPYRWRIAGSKGSERHALTDMLDELPSNARIIADAEYVGYPLWSAILDSKRSFLVRVGSNVSLLKNLGSLRIRNGFVYFWPTTAMRKLQPPLKLRLIKVDTGKETIYLVSSELDMSDQAACELYRQRWGVEVFFRTVKQSCQRSKLRCCTPRNLLTEIHWTLIGVWAAFYYAKQVQRDQPGKRARLSPVKIIRAFAAATTSVALKARAAALLISELTQAVLADESNRTSSKKSRSYPRKKRPKSCGPPKIASPTKLQMKYAKLFEVG
ncbi:IS4 family transposase [Blastopirellula marina]|uniref:Probable transposase n=1 Tax=Blastopirellula marina DSM 3645 TaxID=314230 RepID=A4A0C6_9BACT|nr:IS4 family transposase [Blastopirellula marina]EAQ77746.1 probable transposase [Blastopirellula marina DSM 3645]